MPSTCRAARHLGAHGRGRPAEAEGGALLALSQDLTAGGQQRRGRSPPDRVGRGRAGQGTGLGSQRPRPSLVWQRVVQLSGVGAQTPPSSPPKTCGVTEDP